MQLTPKQKAIWIQVDLERIPQVEVARRLGKSPESVCRLLARARRRIQPLLTAFDAAGGDRDQFCRMLANRG